MHAVLITFASMMPPDEFAAQVVARPAGETPGLVTVTWLRDGARLGGFHLFADRPAAERYL